MSRRQTLGQLSPNSMAMRIDQSTKDKNPQKKRLTILAAPAGRMSMAPPRAGGPLIDMPRRSSLYGSKVGANGSKTDPRPINDKQYIANCIRSLIGYLTTHGYDHAVTPKMLQSPTSKEFAHMIGFLFRKVDPNFEFRDKIEDEVPNMYKRLHYPFLISKSALYAVGSPTTWPALLAALAWIVELLSYEERAAEAKNHDFSRPSDEPIESDLFFTYVSRSYNHFLAAEDDVVARLDAELASRFESRGQETAREVERLEAEAQRVRAEIQAVRAAPSVLIELTQKRTDLAADIDKFHKLIGNLHKHKRDLAKKVEERQADVGAREAEVRALEGENEGLRARIASQPYSKEDVERMTRDRRRMEESLAAATAQRERSEAQRMETAAELDRAAGQLEAMSRAYNQHAERLGLLPAHAKRAKGIDYEFRIHPGAATPAEIRVTDLKGAVVPGLARTREHYLLRARELGEERLALQERLDRAEERIADLRDEGRVLEEEHRRLEAQFKGAKDALDAEVRTVTQQADRLRGEVDQLRSVTGGSVADSEEGVQQLALELQELQRRCQREQETVHRALEAAIDSLISHKSHIEQTLARVQAHVVQAHRDVEVLAA